MMQPALLIRLRPLGPWRSGPGDGGLDRVDTLFRSDRLFSAVTIALNQLGFREEWLSATARNDTPTVAFSSLFPFQGDTLFAVPPATLWPPPATLVTAPSPVFLAKIRWQTARYVPLSLIDSLLTGESILAEQWLPDGESGCLLRRDRPNASPFRLTMRRSAAIDRLAQRAPSVTATACLEFEPSAGLWTLVRFADSSAENAWSGRIQAAFRLLADSGFGGKRSSGWGQTQAPEFERGSWPRLLLPKTDSASKNASPPAIEESPLFWLLSLYSPAASDRIDWANGDYQLTLRAGRLQDGARSGTEKKSVRLISEGSVLAAPKNPIGAAVDVAPDGFEHPVYRSGIALALELPVAGIQTEAEIHMALQPVEEPGSPEAVIEPAQDVQPAHENETPENETPAAEAAPEQLVSSNPEPALALSGEPAPEPPAGDHPAADAEESDYEI